MRVDVVFTTSANVSTQGGASELPLAVGIGSWKFIAWYTGACSRKGSIIDWAEYHMHIRFAYGPIPKGKAPSASW
jgi:hypothetical protein